MIIVKLFVIKFITLGCFTFVPFVFCFFSNREATVWVSRDAQWAPDEQVTHCGLCEKEFNLARRKVSRPTGQNNFQNMQ